MDNQNDPSMQPANQNEAPVNPPSEPTVSAPVEAQPAPIQESAPQPPTEPVVSTPQAEVSNSQPIVNTPPAQQNPAAQQAPIVDTAEIPSVWPGAFAGFKQVRPTIKPVALSIFLIYLAYEVVDIIVVSILKSQTIVSDLINLVIGTLLSGTILSIYYAVLKHEDASLGVAFKKATSKFFNLLAVSLIVGFLSMLSFIAFIVPFFFIAPRLFFAPFLVMGEGLGIGESVSKSWSMTKGNLGKIYGIYGLMLLLCLLFITIIGIPFAIYWLIIAYGLAVQLARFMYANDGTATVPMSQPQAPTVTPASPPLAQ
ncbi:MAG TPA: hypothetical protein VIH90_06295 [Candidatus Saccharimonadales bacterium]